MTTVPSIYCCSKVLSFKWLIQQPITASVNMQLDAGQRGGGGGGGGFKVSRYDFWEGAGGTPGQQV